MSTRATIHFCYPGSKEPEAIVYRHSDGYPEGLGEDLKRFVAEVRKQTSDTRFDDPSYLAAKWVVFDAGENGRLNFLGVGICLADPGDIEYRYTVTCDGKPTITHEKV